MIDITCHIHNLGDFANCLPVLSGIYLVNGEKINLSLTPRLKRFRGMVDLLKNQKMFNDVWFIQEKQHEGNPIAIHDSGSTEYIKELPFSTIMSYNCVRSKLKFSFYIDEHFVLNVPKFDCDYDQEFVLIGDRWSSNEEPDLDTRRSSNVIRDNVNFENVKVKYLDYTKSLLYNCSLIKYNNNPFVTTFTGIGILADLMKKNQYILWGDDIRNWDNKPIVESFKRHYFHNRNSKLIYVKDFDEKWLVL